MDFAMGADLPETLTAMDAQLDQERVQQLGSRIVEVWSELAADPANHAEAEGCVPLRLIRRALGEQPREYVDAAVRWLDTQPAGMPGAEIVFMTKPTPADMAQAVCTWVDDEIFMANLISFEIED